MVFEVAQAGPVWINKIWRGKARAAKAAESRSIATIPFWKRLKSSASVFAFDRFEAVRAAT